MDAVVVSLRRKDHGSFTNGAKDVTAHHNRGVVKENDAKIAALIQL